MMTFTVKTFYIIVGQESIGLMVQSAAEVDEQLQCLKYPRLLPSLFYLMVLVTSHTISKSIATTESFDGIDDSFNDLKRNRRAKHDRIHPRHETLWTRSPETRSITEIILESEGTEKHGRKAARNLQGLWKKYHNRKAKNKAIPVVQNEPQYSKLFNNLVTDSSNLVEYVTSSDLKLAKEARPKKHAKGKTKNIDYDDLLNIEDNLEKPPMKYRRSLRRPATRHSTKRCNKKFQYDPNNNITNILGTMSTKLDELKKLYSKSQYTSFEDITEPTVKNKNKAKLNSVNLFDVPDAFKSTSNMENYEGTAAIEAILNEVKCRAIDMIASHRPSVSDLITNAVTETTYSVDPLLKHMNVINPLIAVSTLVTINELPNKVTARAMQKEVTDNNLGYYIFQTESTRKARCAQNKAGAKNQNVDENLQSKLKTIFQKVREDLNNIREENKKIQETLKLANKSAIHSTLAARLESPTTASSKDPDDEAPRESSSYHSSRATQKENVPRHKNQEPITLPTIDASMFEDNDYDMLSVYEHILAKTQESNMMKYLSTKLHPSMKRGGRQAPAHKFRKKVSIDPEESLPDNSFDETSTDYPIEETSFEALTQKLAYNDFVNGYKHYLKFEKDMAQSNFSNLVRYQAHKHHAVDEIGKYILDKIPQIPPADRFKRDFFDYYDDDQDISTQHDDSWIKKYFNYFVEHSATPKKYHTSQTVPMKAPVEYKKHTTERIDHKDFLKNHVLLRTHTVDMDLDQLTHMIQQDTSTSVPIPCAYSFPTKSSSSSLSHTKVGIDRKDLLKHHNLDELLHIMQQEKSTSILLPIRQGQKITSYKKEHFNQNLIAIKNALHSPHIVDKFFSEIGRSAKKFTNKKYNNDNTEEAVVGDSSPSRSRRHDLIEDDQIDQENFEEREAIQRPKSKVLASLLGHAPTEEKAKGKVGYANVDVVPAAPKGKVERKNGRLMTWFNKLKWHKKKAKPKREAERVPRFNIVKKLKQLFDGKPDKLGLSDYDLATTELEGFNPLKYDSSQHIHDIQKQLPEISYDRKMVSQASIAKYPPFMSHRTVKKPARKGPNQKKHEKKYHTLIASMENYNDGINLINPTPTQPVDNSKIQQIKHEIDNIDMKLSSTPTRARVRNVQSPTSLYNFEADLMNSEDLESPGRSESDTINLNPLTENPARLESKKAGEKSKTILTRDAKSHFSQSRNYDDYNQGSQVGEVEMGDYMKKRESTLLNDTDRIRAINNISHKIDTTPDSTATTTSYDDNMDDFDDLIIWNNNILDSENGWSGALKKMSMPQDKIQNMTDQFADFLNSTRPNKNQSEDDINDLSTRLHNAATKYSKQYAKPTSATPRKVINHSSEKKKQHPLNNFFLDDDRIVTSEVMLKRLNSLNSILGRPEERLKNIYVKKNNKPGIVENMSDRDISMDSTIFAYDDGYGFFTDDNRKLSKNQVDIGNSTTSLTTIARPPQHYTTPLPMTPQQFDKFLKYNELDVQTVTSPIPETPEMLSAWAHKEDEQAKTEHYDEVELKRKLHLPLSLPKKISNQNGEFKSRNQMSKMISDEGEMIWPNLEFNYRDLKQSFKRKLKFNKPDERNIWIGKTFSASTKGEKEIEVTLINFDSEDVTQGSDFDVNYYDSPYRKDEQTDATKASTKTSKPKTTEDSDNMTEKTEKVSDDQVKTSTTVASTKAMKSKLSDLDARVALKILHNQLIYNNSLQQKLKTTTDAPRDILRFSHLHKQLKKGPTPSPEPEGFQITLHQPRPTYKATTKLTQRTTTTCDPFYYNTDATDQITYTQTLTPADFLKTLKLATHIKPQKLPKRIQIHSHSYKYNIEYQDEVPQLEADKGFSALIINQLLKQNAAKRNKLHGFRTPHSENPIHKSKMGTKTSQLKKSMELSQETLAPLSLGQRDKITNKEKLIDKVLLSTTVAPAGEKTQATSAASDWDDYLSFTKRLAGQRQKRFTWHLPNNLLAKSSTPALNTMSVIVTSSMTTDKGKVEEKRNDEALAKLRDPLQGSASQTTEMVLTVVTPKFLNNLIRHLHDKGTKQNNSGVFVSDNCRIFTKDGKVFIETPKFFEMYQNNTVLALNKEESEEENIKIDKRESNDFYTAKDVAALEVIIDLIKNTGSEEEVSSVTVTPSMIHSISEFGPSFSSTYSPTYALSPSEFPITNSIQVHIALPNYLENEINSKRSIDRLRKVFSAKMYTPVDLEYQIHSFDESSEITTAPTTTVLAPGMYLLVENCNNASLPRGSFILKPISHSINIANLSLSSVKVRQAEVHTENTHTEKVATTANDKLSKVTLSKDFVAAINKHLMQLYESLHANNENDRKITRNTNLKVNATKRTRRGLNWRNIKNYFQTSKYCECKANRTMCRACAASDAVMGELIFELNNIVKYMNDHCVEIQTYFRSNPSGGRKLRDAIRKVDQSLDSYYKKVKGKCKVKTCCDTYTFINKRELANVTAVATEPDSHKTHSYMKLADDIESFAHDVNNASKLNICFNDALKKGTYKLFGVVAKCTNESNNSKSNKKKNQKDNDKYKNVYSLDNVNVNIICSNDSNKQLSATNQDTNRYGQHLLDYFADEAENNNNEKKRKWFFKNIFRRKQNIHAYTKLDKYKKREVQIDNPLNADTGGSFWSDYIHKIQTDRPRLVRETNKREPESTTSSLRGTISSLNIDPVSVTVTYRSTTTENILKVTPIEIIQTKSLTVGGEVTEKAAEESLNYNINELFRLLGNVYIADRNETTFNTGSTSNVTVQKFTKGMTTLKPSDWYNCKKKKNKGKCKVCKKTKCKCANKKKTTKNTTKRSDITSLSVKPKTKPKTKTKTTKTTAKTPVNALPTKNLVDLSVVNSTGTWVGVPANSASASAGVTQIMDTIGKIKNSTMAYVNSYYGQRLTSKVTIKSTTVAKDQNQISRLLHMLGARSFSDKNKEDNSVMNTEIEITSDENPTILIINDDALSDDTSEESTNATQTTKKLTSTTQITAPKVTKLISESQPEMTSDQTEKTTNSTQTEPETPSRVTIAAQTTKNLRHSSKLTTVSQTSKTTNITETPEEVKAESTEEPSSSDEMEKSTEEHESEHTTGRSDNDAKKSDEDMTDGRTENVIKSLLLSVLKFETKRLDSEYERLIGRSAEDNVAPRAASVQPTDDIINVRIKILNTTGLATRPISTTTSTVPIRTEYELSSPIYDLAHDLPISHKAGQENIVNKFLHKFVVKTRKEEPSVEVHLHSARGQMLHSTMQSSVIKERIGDDSDSEGLISAALILRDRKEGVTSIKPTVNVQFQSPTPSKLPRSYVVVKDEVTMQVEPPNSAISLNFKTCDTPTQICDLQDTFAHLLYCQQQMKTQYYTKFLKSMICYKFIDGPDYFIIKSKSNKFFCFSKDEVIDKVKGKRRFDWIRSKRSVSVSNNDATNRNNDNEEASDDLGEANEGKDGSDAAYSLLADSVPNDGFEVMVKDKYGIYRSVEGARLKRTTCTDRIGEELRNLPPIDIPKNMIYAIEGETVTLTCYPKVECPGRLTWWVDTPHAQDNVMVDGEQLVITAVKPGNVANYSCGQGNMVLNTTGIRVVSLPIYDVVTTPLYICNKHCSDHELKVMHELGPQMTDVGCLSGSCVIKIDRPRCLTDLASNASLLSVRSIMRLPRRAPPCGIECARDAHGSWAVVAATSAPLLAKIKVVVERDNSNVTLTPTTDSHRRLVLSMTLTDDPNIINQAPFAVVPGDIEVVVSCPHGYVLVAKLRICMATPPAIDRSYTGRSRRLHRYDWWQWPVWCVVVGGLLAVGGAGAACVRRGARDPRPTKRAPDREHTQLVFHRVSAAASSASGPAPVPRRRISPSRVILPRLFRHASSRISQETKLGSAKKHQAPPLPPIDFDS